MSRRSYEQFCGLARALDLIGERWTLLIVRELASGPKRYTDLATSLEGVGSSLLASRVKQLEADGLVVRSQLPPPAASVVYELTESGWALARAMAPLALWGMRNLLDGGPGDREAYRAEWGLAMIAQLIDPDQLSGVETVYDFDIEGSFARLHIHDGRAEVLPGKQPGPADAVITSTIAALASIISGAGALSELLASRDIVVDGDPEAVSALVGLLPLGAAS
ncbi:winged helix-turn-helix transcriptional regulator [Segniliparus rugosus]|uniref:HTH hxlR-type domain-containing protein n=1 Tax=Segniliparus rugosus (strain ATCC BAA-974 / DSM 45345 / CCUG 50838 / CIP 108380 / JCM 13579 / CDC 945) TaxID=679197 RepID=E5XKX5_SEGRC|nr:winged helix-turn-helix transcriptional regulator [Segniliparus rugosus]EFV14957.1 hypothetical protein HMPREF9336_00144 [Segniliparus rugosus ATCC BAA-974]